MQLRNLHLSLQLFGYRMLKLLFRQIARCYCGQSSVSISRNLRDKEPHWSTSKNSGRVGGAAGSVSRQDQTRRIAIHHKPSTLIELRTRIRLGIERWRAGKQGRQEACAGLHASGSEYIGYLRYLHYLHSPVTISRQYYSALYTIAIYRCYRESIPSTCIQCPSRVFCAPSPRSDARASP